MKYIILLLALLAVSGPEEAAAQAEINGGVNVSVNVPVYSWTSYTRQIPSPSFFYSMDKFNDGTKYKIEVIADPPYLVQNIQMQLFTVPVGTMSGSITYIGSEETFTWVDYTSFAFTCTVPSTAPLGQTQLIKFRIYRRVGIIWDWQTTFYCYLNTACPNNFTFSSGTLSGLDYEASDYINVATAVNPGGGRAELDGGQSVSLLPGFSSNLGAGGEIVALIDGCGGAYRPGNTTGVSGTEAGASANADWVTIAPNPSTGLFRITSSREEAIDLEVTDIAGRSIARTRLTRKGSHQLDLSAYPRGMYLLRLAGDGKVITRKLMLQ